MTDAFLGLYDNSALLGSFVTIQMGSTRMTEVEFLTSCMKRGQRIKLIIEFKVGKCEYYLALLSNEVLIQAPTWMNLKIILLN
jgi:hypothetical protein